MNEPRDIPGVIAPPPLIALATLLFGLERYRKMLENPRDGAQRRIILKLLAEEEAKLREGVSQADQAASVER
jgi:hypothetical protein